MASDNRVVCVGLVRNCARFLPRLLEQIARLGSLVNDWRYIFLESDSEDNSLELLRQFDEEHRRGAVVTFGKLSKQMRKRTERLAFLRNKYMGLLNQEKTLAGFDFLIVLDMDGANERLDHKRIVEIMEESDRTWSGIFANQSEVYYDIWALRHPEWSPDDCWKQYRSRPFWMGKRVAKQKYIGSRMVRLPPEGERIEVDSAFGGLGIYDLEQVRDCRYLGLDGDGNQICEHVEFNRQIRAKGQRLFIDPSLINGRGTQPHS